MFSQSGKWNPKWVSVSNGGADPSWTPTFITTSTIGSDTYVYVTDNASKAFVCSASATPGALTACTMTGLAAGTGDPMGWAPAGIGASTQGANSYTYVTDNSGNAYVCSASAASGALSSCAVSNGGQTTWVPLDISVR